MSQTRIAVAQAMAFVLLFFPIICLIELRSPLFFVPFIEEFFGRLLPFVIVYRYLHDNVNPVTVGISAGMTFGVLEIASKISILGYFSPLMLLPVVFVHVPNAVIQSVVVNACYNDRSYALIPTAYIICVLWHWLYNAYFYVV